MSYEFNIIASLVELIQDDIAPDSMSKHMRQALDEAIQYLNSQE